MSEHYASVCFLLNISIASLKAGSDFAARIASISSLNSGFSESGFKLFKSASFIVPDSGLNVYKPFHQKQSGFKGVYSALAV